MNRDLDHAMTREEIAKRLGVSVSYVGKIEARALAKLREAIERIERENVVRQFERKP